MIQLDNNNIYFDIEDVVKLGYYSISLTDNTNNIIFKTDNVERMTIANNGNVGIGIINPNYNLDINGSINATDIYINGINIETHANNTSNYVRYASNILIGRINDTSNYVEYTSNILVGRINDTSNYVGYTSNILTSRINDTSNYVRYASNILVSRINDTSNYVGYASNILIGRINNTSNYVRTTSDILIIRINDTSNYVRTTYDILSNRIDYILGLDFIGIKITDANN